MKNYFAVILLLVSSQSFSAKLDESLHKSVIVESPKINVKAVEVVCKARACQTFTSNPAKYITATGSGTHYSYSYNGPIQNAYLGYNKTSNTFILTITGP